MTQFNLHSLVICDPDSKTVLDNLGAFFNIHKNVVVKTYNGFADFVKSGLKVEIT
jgi:hypothetical protein